MMRPSAVSRSSAQTTDAAAAVSRKPLVRPVRPATVATSGAAEPENEGFAAAVPTVSRHQAQPQQDMLRHGGQPQATRRPLSAGGRAPAPRTTTTTTAGSYAAQYFPSAHISNIHATLRTLNPEGGNGSTSRIRSSSAHLDVSSSAIQRTMTPSATAVDLLTSTQRSLERAQRDLHTSQRQRLEAEAALNEMSVEASRWRSYAEELEMELEGREPISGSVEVHRESSGHLDDGAVAYPPGIIEAFERACRVATEDFVDPVPDTPESMMDFLADRLVDLRASTEQLADADSDRLAMATRLTTIAAQWEQRERTLEARIASLEEDLARATARAPTTLPSPQKPLAEQLKLDELFALMRDVANEPTAVPAPAQHRDVSAAVRRSEPDFARLMNQVEDGIGSIRSQRLRARVENSERLQLRAQLEAVTAEMESLHGQWESRLRDVQRDAERKLAALNETHANEKALWRVEAERAQTAQAAKLASVEARVREIEAEFEQQRVAAAASEERAREAAEALSEATAEKEELVQQLDAAEARLEAINSQREESEVTLDRKYAELQARVAELQDGVQMANDRTKGITAKYDAAAAEVEALQKQNLALRTELEDERDALQDLRSQLEAAKSASIHAEENASANAEEKAEQLHDRIRELETMVDELRRLHDEANQRIATLEEEAEEATTLIETLSPGRPREKTAAAATERASIVPLDGVAKALAAVDAAWPADAPLPPLSSVISPTEVRSWSFSAVVAADSLEEQANSGGVLYEVGLRVADAIGAFANDKDDAQRTAFGRFLLAASRMYRDTPYHNIEHAADVVHGTGALLLMAPALLDAMPAEERLAVLTAAAGHDVGHPGRNNAFLVNTGDALADRYPDRGVLEGYHTAATQELARSTGLLKAIGAANAARFRAVISAAILNTDMGKHAHGVEALLQRGQSTGGWDANDAAQRLELLSAVVHAADIANSAKPDHATVLLWTERVTAEFEAQGREEMERGLPVSPGCQPGAPLAKGQLFFIDFLCLPLFRALAIALEGSCDGQATDGTSTPPSLASSDASSSHRIRDVVLQALLNTRAHWASQCGDPPLPPPPALPSRARSASTSPPMDVGSFAATPSETDVRLWKERERMLLAQLRKLQDMVRVLEQRAAQSVGGHADTMQDDQGAFGVEDFQSPIQRSGTLDADQPRSGSREPSLEALPSPLEHRGAGANVSSGRGGDSSTDLTMQLLDDLSGHSSAERGGSAGRHADPHHSLQQSPSPSGGADTSRHRYAAVDDSDEEVDAAEDDGFANEVNGDDAGDSEHFEESPTKGVSLDKTSSPTVTRLSASPTAPVAPSSSHGADLETSPVAALSPEAVSRRQETPRSSAESSPNAHGGGGAGASGSRGGSSHSSPPAAKHSFDDSDDSDGEGGGHDDSALSLPGQESPVRQTVTTANPFAASPPPTTATPSQGTTAVGSMVPPPEDDDDEYSDDDVDADEANGSHQQHQQHPPAAHHDRSRLHRDSSSDAEDDPAPDDYDEDYDNF